MSNIQTNLNVTYVHVNLDTGKLRIDDTPDFDTPGHQIFEVDRDYVLSLTTKELNDSVYVYEHIQSDHDNAELIFLGE